MDVSERSKSARMSHRRASRASSLALHQDHRDWRTTSRPVKASLREYLLKTGWSSGLFCGGYEEESLHGQTGSVFGFHLLLQQNPRTSASGGRNAAVLPSLSSLRASDDPDTRKARPHRANARAGPVDPPVDCA